MNINLTIIKDYLDLSGIKTESRLDSQIFPFSWFEIYREGAFHPGILYISESLCLPELPQLNGSGTFSLLCLGDIPAGYRNVFECVSISENVSMLNLVSQVTAIFKKFMDWETSMLKLIQREATLHEIGATCMPFFNNPVNLATNFLKTVFLISEGGELPEWYLYKEGEYLPQEELDLIFNDPVYHESIKKKDVYIYPPEMYGFRMLSLNLFEHGEYIGRLTVDELWRPFRDSDWSILILFSGYCREAYRRYDTTQMTYSKQGDELIEYLLEKEIYSGKFDQLLSSLGLGLYEYYTCLFLRPDKEKNVQSAREIILHLHHIIGQSYFYQIDGGILVLLNLKKPEAVRPYLEIIRKFCRKQHYVAGISCLFKNLGDLKIHLHQAQRASMVCMFQSGPLQVSYFNNCILDEMTDILSETNKLGFYASNEISRLMEYDEVHRTELVHTLYVLLKNNMSPSAAANELHVHRSTVLYRIEKITSMTGLDLDDFETKLYLALFIKIRSKAGENLPQKRGIMDLDRRQQI